MYGTYQGVPGRADLGAVGWLLDALREAGGGAREQAAALADRLPGPACSGCSWSSRAVRIGSGSAGRLAVALPGRGAGTTLG